MTARLLVAPDRLRAGPLTVDGADHAYLFRARRLATGDRVVVFDGAGREAAAVVGEVGPVTATLAVDEPVEVPRPGPHVTVLQALIKGERMDWCLEKLVEVGVDAVVPVETERTVVRLDGARRARRVERHRAIVAAAARQCGRADLPGVAEVVPLADALAATSAELRLVAHPAALDHPLPRDAAARVGSVAILIGPEGGLSAGELDAAVAAGFDAVGLGPYVLRAETAGPVAVALVRAGAPERGFAPGPGPAV